jgi:hypothetical protein
MAQQPEVGHGLFIHEVSRSHNDASQSVWHLWTNDQLVAETSTWQHNTYNRQISMPLVGFEPIFSADKRRQNHALDRASTGTGIF